VAETPELKARYRGLALETLAFAADAATTASALCAIARDALGFVVPEPEMEAALADRDRRRYVLGDMREIAPQVDLVRRRDLLDAVAYLVTGGAPPTFDARAVIVDVGHALDLGPARIGQVLAICAEGHFPMPKARS